MHMEKFSARNLRLHAQRKILGRIASRWVAKAFLDDVSGRLFDNLNRLMKEYTDKDTADGFAENVIKTVVTVVIFFGSNELQVSHSQQIELIATLRRKLRKVALTVIAFHEVEFSYDAEFIATAISECCSLLKRIVTTHMTEKSTKRIDNVFRFIGDSNFLDAVFRKDGVHRNTMSRIVDDLNFLVETNSF